MVNVAPEPMDVIDRSSDFRATLGTVAGPEKAGAQVQDLRDRFGTSDYQITRARPRNAGGDVKRRIADQARGSAARSGGATIP